jgi:hypothetical protein
MSANQTPSRRTFLKYMAGATGLVLAGGMIDQGDSEAAPVLVNHVGYTPQAPKVCLTRGWQSVPFSVVDMATGSVVYRGMMLPQLSDLGFYVAGDFGQLQQAGVYQVFAARWSIRSPISPSSVAATAPAAITHRAISTTAFAWTTASIRTWWVAGTMRATFGNGWIQPSME